MTPQFGEVLRADTVFNPPVTDDEGFVLFRIYDQASREVHSDVFDGRHLHVDMAGRYFGLRAQSWRAAADSAFSQSFRGGPVYMPDFTIGTLIHPVKTPVNQIPNLRLWRPRTATFAHDLDIAHGSYLVDVTLSEEDRATLFLYGRMLAGAAWLALDAWEAIDPHASFIRNGETILRWKDEEQISERIVAVMTKYRWWARRMAESANLPLFSVRLGHGHLPGVYRRIEPWVPESPFVGQADIIGLLDPVEVANRIAAWQAENVAAWKVAVHHYDTVTALPPPEPG